MDTRWRASEEAEPQRGWTPGGVPTRRLGPKGGGHQAVCQRGGWAPRGWTPSGVPARTLGPEGVDIGRCVSEDAGPRRRMDTKRCVSEDSGPRRRVD